MTTTTTTGPRRDRVRALLGDRGLDALLVTDLLNVRYLTGYAGSHGALLLGADPALDTFATDERYTAVAARQVPDLPAIIDRNLAGALAARLLPLGTGAIVGVETHSLTVDEHAALLEALTPAGPRAVSAARVVEAVRVVKDNAELAALERACAATATAFTRLLAEPFGGRTERAVAARLDALLLAAGGDRSAFDPVVASGPNGASPHHDPGDRELRPGDLVVLDFGAAVAGYHADMTRTVFVGGPGESGGPTGSGSPVVPADWQRQIHEVVQAAATAGRAAARAGAQLGAVDAAARDVVAVAGLGEAFTHGLGHGVGLALHEDPLLRPDAAGTLEEGTPVTVEPGVYLAGRGGVRIEDTVVVGATAAGVLTECPRGLIVVY